MRRFIKVYLTIFVIALLATNLVMVTLYGQRFFFSATDGLELANTGLTASVIVINGVLLVVFLVFWLIARHYYRSTVPPTNDYIKE